MHLTDFLTIQMDEALKGPIEQFITNPSISALLAFVYKAVMDCGNGQFEPV